MQKIAILTSLLLFWFSLKFIGNLSRGNNLLKKENKELKKSLNFSEIKSTTYFKNMMHLSTYADSLRKKLAEIDSLNSFLVKLGERESANNFNSVNTLGYLGKYQFNINTVRWVLNRNITKKEFLQDSLLQELAMAKYLLLNKKILTKKLPIDSIINNSEYTISSLLAAAHLGGAGAVINYFKKGHISKDAYGTSIKEYMEFKQF